jgi:hypothetical protein
MKLKNQKIWRLGLICALSLSAVIPVSSQEKERRNISSDSQQLYVISAKAGGVNYISGAVRVEREATGVSQILAKSDELNTGDKVSTSENGKIEILLNPGSFLRLAENSDFEFKNADLESLQLKLNRGSALLEASGVGDDGAEISVTTPQGRIAIERSGIYRINVSQNATEVFVWEGQARVGNDVLKEKRKAVFQNGTGTVARFDKDDTRDALDVWSKDRAKELARLNEKLKSRELARAFTSYSPYGFARSSFRSGGFWVLDRFTGSYCYVPYGADPWDSPYGYFYNRNLIWGRTPIIIRPQVYVPIETKKTGGFPNGGSAPVILAPQTNTDSKKQN